MDWGTGGEMIDRIAKIPNIRAVTWLGFYGFVLLAWVVIYQMARGGGWLCGPEVVALLPLGGFWALFFMWAVMMTAMMMPTIVPTLQTYEDLPGSGRSGWFGLIAGYGAVWLIGAAGFAGLQVFAMRSGLVDLAGAATSWWIAAALFAVAGVWQFTRIKVTCQDACLSPMQYFIGNWKPGVWGGWQMGVEIGLVCVGCCWAIMTLGFVGGAMSLLWMGLATVFMVIEKLPEIGQHIRRPAGVLLLGASLFCGIQGF